MGKAKEIELKPISVQAARKIVVKYHYSGKYDTRSNLNIGVFYEGALEGAIQFGPSVDKRKIQGLVKGTGWNDWLDLHRVAFSDKLPRNSESRALAICMRLIRKHKPNIKWVISYADATQSGDGAIYRACGFVLTGITKNKSMWEMPDGEVICQLVLNPTFSNGPNSKIKRKYGKTDSAPPRRFLESIGARQLPGYQLRYVYFLDPAYRQRLAVPEIPYAEIAKRGIGMYRGQSVERAGA